MLVLGSVIFGVSKDSDFFISPGSMHADKTHEKNPMSCGKESSVVGCVFQDKPWVGSWAGCSRHHQDDIRIGDLELNLHLPRLPPGEGLGPKINPAE